MHNERVRLRSRLAFVASAANFSAPLARKDQAAGAIISIDPRGAMLTVPADFAAAGGQARAAGGRVLLFTANSPAFLNRVHNAGAVTADYPSVARPTAMSLNNAFGRPWFASAPSGAKGPGAQSVIDPDGSPLAGAPDKIAGGVFTGALTNRAPQLVPGAMTTASLALALLGRSPDGSGRAVFAGLQSDGSLVQVHVELGVDSLAPAGTLAPQDDLRRRGMVFNWVPNRILYVTDPARNAIVALTLVVDGDVFRVEDKRQITPAGLDLPIDIAPAVVEVANPAFSSNTTLAGNADMYVANRGNGTIVRLKQDGAVVAIRRITLPGLSAIGADRLNGIAVSPDASRIWLTISGSLPGHPEGAVIGLIDTIPEAQIASGAVARGDGVHGRVNRIRRADGTEQIGRFGWKAEVATVRQFVANAMRNEIGITNPLAPMDWAPVGTPGHERCAGEGVGIEDDGSIANALTAFVTSLPPLPVGPTSAAGAATFAAIGCALCHTPSFESPAGPVSLYSDLLLHDIGPDLDDKVVQSNATGRDWRTTPLWGLSARPRFLHDGRATTVTEAITAHAGEAARARQRFRALSPEERKALLAFLAGL